MHCTFADLATQTTPHNTQATHPQSAPLFNGVAVHTTPEEIHAERTRSYLCSPMASTTKQTRSHTTSTQTMPDMQSQRATMYSNFDAHDATKCCVAHDSIFTQLTVTNTCASEGPSLLNNPIVNNCTAISNSKIQFQPTVHSIASTCTIHSIPYSHTCFATLSEECTHHTTHPHTHKHKHTRQDTSSSCCEQTQSVKQCPSSVVTQPMQKVNKCAAHTKFYHDAAHMPNTIPNHAHHSKHAHEYCGLQGREYHVCPVVHSWCAKVALQDQLTTPTHTPSQQTHTHPITTNAHMGVSREMAVIGTSLPCTL